MADSTPKFRQVYATTVILIVLTTCSAWCDPQFLHHFDQELRLGYDFRARDSCLPRLMKMAIRYAPVATEHLQLGPAAHICDSCNEINRLTLFLSTLATLRPLDPLLVIPNSLVGASPRPTSSLASPCPDNGSSSGP